MKKLSYLFITLAVATIFSSCFKDDCDGSYTYQVYNAIFMSPEDMRAAIDLEEARELEAPGKIYMYNEYVFINELGKGLHIFDNSDLSNPINLGFLNIPGNYDLAIKDDVLYADNSYDLISLDISDLSNPQVIDIDEAVYPSHFSEEQGILLGYNITDETITVDCDNIYYGDDVIWLESDVIATSGGFDPNVSSGDASSGSGGVGVGGSFARFTISANHLYIVDEFSLSVFSLEDCRNPEFTSSQILEWGIETIFPYQDKLFVGSTAGVYIFENRIPQSPTLMSRFEHARACDPVFVENDKAYVTLRNGNQCAGFENQLDIIDVSDISAPSLIATHQMINPHGLSVVNQQIILCEGTSGLKIIDAKDDLNLELLNHIDDFHAYDVISMSETTFMLIGNDGFYQYRLKDNFDLDLLSHIPVKS